MKWYVIPVIVLVVILGYVIIKYVPAYLMDTYLEKKTKELIQGRSRILTIEVRDTGGYLVHVPDGKTMHSIKWNDVSKAELYTDESKLLVYRSAVIDTIGSNTHSGFLNLIKAIPNNISMNERLLSFKQNYFRDLSCCDICGKVSLKQGECLHCGNASYEKYVNNNKLMGITDDEGKLEYTRRHQLTWFYDEHAINFHDDYFLFEQCTNWKPSVSKAEVLKYGTEE